MIGLASSPTLRTALFVGVIAAGAAGGQEAGFDLLDPADRDPSTAACADFYRHANGGWLSRHPVPADRGRISNYDLARNAVDAVLTEILDGGDSEALRSPAERLVGRFFASCLDEDRRERSGLATLSPYLERVDAATFENLSALLGELHRIGVRVPFRLDAGVSPSDARRKIAHLDQSGMVFRDPGSYRPGDAAGLDELDAYRRHAATLFRLAGRPARETEADAKSLVQFESMLAEAALDLRERRDPLRTTHEMDWDEAAELLGRLDWQAYLGALDLSVPDRANVQSPEYLRRVDELLAGALPIASWRAYLRFHLLNNAAPFLDHRFRDARHAWDARRSGAEELPALRAQCIGASRALLGDLLGWEFAQRTAPQAMRPRVVAMAENLRSALANRIAAADWLEEATRGEALRKLERMRLSLIGPSQSPEFRDLELGDDFVANVIAAAVRDLRADLLAIGHPVEPDAWPIPAFSTFAGYLPDENRILFPATKLAPPFFDSRADDALLYGSLGATLAHEMFHGFDDEGRQYDADGNVRDWWSPADAAEFEARSRRLVEQYDAYEIGPGLTIDGRRTLGENLADLGGIALAFDALQLALEGRPKALLGGLTAEQRFFYGWARHWRANYRDEYLADLVATDVHPPTHWRANGSLANLTSFRDAFGCREGDPMSLPESRRTIVW